MAPKEIFNMLFYGGLKDAISSISDEEAKDVYICKLIIDNLYDECNYYDIKDVHLEYNTNTALQKQKNEIICNWEKYSSGELYMCGLRCDKWQALLYAETNNVLTLSEACLWKWVFIDIPFYAYKNYLDWKNQINYSDKEDKEYEFSVIHFKNEMIELVKKLFEDKIILQKFGKNITFIVECIEDEEDPISVSDIAVA